MNVYRIATILEEKNVGREVTVRGWVRTFRSRRFIALNDGSSVHNLQCVVDFESMDESVLKKITTGACIEVCGDLVNSQGAGQDVEIAAKHIVIHGVSDPEEYPLQPKKHSLEFLRDIAHLRPRTQTFGAVFRLRHHLSYAIHHYFHQRGFYNVHTPIITGSDAEGAGEMFRVTTLDAADPPKTDEGLVNYREDFFEKEVNLTVSGQLEAELFALGLGKVYTFGPTFRAENSNTSRHLAEFWMIEPEVAFADLAKNMDLAEDFLRSIIRSALTHCADDLAFLSARQTEEEKGLPANLRSEMTLIDQLTFVAENGFRRVSYTEAIDILKQSKPNKKKKFQYLIEEWGADLQSEHERFLVEKHFKCPVIIFDYPAKIKAFYMRLNDDGKTVRAMDVLFPGIGEIIGGSQREERFDVLRQKMADFNIPEDEMNWYLDTRRFGSCVHSGFGLGFERLVQFVTGMGNIRDVIPFPRTPGNCEF